MILFFKKLILTFFYHIFSALKYKNYRFWFIGQIISLLGSWVQTTAQGYLIYELTSSSSYLGIVTFVSGIPVIFFMLYGGVIADRVSKKKLLFVTQSVMMLCSLVLSWLIYFNYIRPWHILVTAFIVGIANAFEVPARQAFVVELVDKKDLANAIALNSIIFNLGVFVGPAIGGFLYAYQGAYICFLINGISFIAILIALLFINISVNSHKIINHSLNQDIIEGIKYVKRHPIIIFLIFNIFILSILGLSIQTIVPVWAVRILHGDSVTTGLLYSSRGLGAMMGSLIVAVLTRYNLTQTLFFIGLSLFPIILFIFSLNDIMFLALILLFVLGVISMLILNNSKVLVQMFVQDEFRGRVLSIYTLMFWGTMPLGGLLIGLLAENLGVRLAVSIAAILLFIIMPFIVFILYNRLKSFSISKT